LEESEYQNYINAKTKGDKLHFLIDFLEDEEDEKVEFMGSELIFYNS
jgi:hypothetical protein